MDRLMVNHELSSAIAQALAHTLWQAAIIAGGTWLICHSLDRQRAQTRYVIFVMGLLLIPLCVPITSAYLVHRANEQARAEFAAVVNAKLSEIPGVIRVVDESAPPAAAPAARRAQQSHNDGFWTRASPWLMGIYICAVAWMLTKVIRSVRGGQSLASCSMPLTDTSVLAAVARAGRAMSFSYTPAVALCSAVTVPAVVGVLRPIVLIPVAVMSGMAPAQIELVVMHELAHIRRHDQVIELVQRIIESLLFFNPGLWWLSNQVRVERECCCDDLVVQAGGVREHYAESLVRAGEIDIHGRELEQIAALAATGRRGELRSRIARLVRAHPRPLLRLGRRPTTAMGTTLVAALLAPILLAVRVVPASLVPPAGEQLISGLGTSKLGEVSPDGNRILAQWSLLHRAVVYGSTQEVKTLLQNHADPNIRAPRGWSPLHFAACLGRTDVAELLCEAGANVNAVNNDSRTPLYCAMGAVSPFPVNLAAPREPMVRFLLHEGADPNVIDRFGMRPLHFAATQGNFAMAKDLLAAGAEVDARGSQGRTPLFFACMHVSAPVIKLLLDRGARVDIADRDGDLPMDALAIARQYWVRRSETGKYESAQLLVQHGAQLNLVRALSLGFQDYVKTELDRSPELINKLQSYDVELVPPLQVAIIADDLNMVNLLLSRHADPNGRGDQSRTALYVATRLGGNPEILEALIAHGADVNALSREDTAPLIMACRARNLKAVQILLSHGADPNLTQEDCESISRGGHRNGGAVGHDSAGQCDWRRRPDRPARSRA